MSSSSDKRSAGGSNVGEWLVNVADDAVVPMTTLEVIDGLRKQRLSEQSLVWRIGMHDWTSIADVPQLRLAAGSRSSTPAAAAVTKAPFRAPVDAQRRRNTLARGFPALKDSASVRRPAGFSPPSSQSTPRSPTLADPGATRLTPVPPVAVPLALQPALSSIPNSLAPTTAEADAGERARAPGPWADLDELLSRERRADQISSRRVVLWAAAGSAALAATFTLWLMHSPAHHEAEQPAIQAAQPGDAPALAPTVEAIIAAPSTSASALKPAPAAARPAPKSVAPRFAEPPKPISPPAPASHAPVELRTAPPPDTTGTAPEVAVVPLAPLDPAPAASAAPESTIAPLTPSAPDSP
ncbi:MAG: DUF4339 domain-containing protein [Pseudomonadota bacterium]